MPWKWALLFDLPTVGFKVSCFSGINPNAKSSYDLDADRPIYPWQPLEKKGGEGKVSRDFVYGAMTLMLAAGLVAALTFLQGAFSL